MKYKSIKVSDESFIRNERRARVPPELDMVVESVFVSVHHPRKGRLTRFLSPNSTYEAQYNWTGGLDESPPYFYVN